MRKKFEAGFYKTVGGLKMENNWLKKARSIEVESRKKLFDKEGVQFSRQGRPTAGLK